MSTRCQIGFYATADQAMDRPSALIYRHSDGYPESEHGVVEQLLPFLERFNATRGVSDAEYCSAQALAHLIQTTRPDDPESPYQFLGYGICADQHLHGDINYFYRVDPSGLTVFNASCGGGWHGFKHLATNPIGKPVTS